MVILFGNRVCITIIKPNVNTTIIGGMGTERIDLRRIDKKRRAVVRDVRKTGITYQQLELLAQMYRTKRPERYDKIMREYYLPESHWIAAGMALKEVGKTDALWNVQEYQDVLRQMKENKRMKKYRRLKPSQRVVQVVSKKEKKSILPTPSQEEHQRRLERLRDAEVL